MEATGVLHPEERVELIDGDLVVVGRVSARWAACNARLIALCQRALGEQALVGPRGPLRLSAHDVPCPSLTLLRPRADFYGEAHPGPDDAFVVVEIAETTLDYDRGVKRPLYARHGIREFWLLDLVGRRLLVHRHPTDGAYGDVQELRHDARIAPLAFPHVELAVAEMLGPASLSAARTPTME